jgi:hypothetical protein
VPRKDSKHRPLIRVAQVEETVPGQHARKPAPQRERLHVALHPLWAGCRARACASIAAELSTPVIAKPRCASHRAHRLTRAAAQIQHAGPVGQAGGETRQPGSSSDAWAERRRCQVSAWRS